MTPAPFSLSSLITVTMECPHGVVRESMFWWSMLWLIGQWGKFAYGNASLICNWCIQPSSHSGFFIWFGLGYLICCFRSFIFFTVSFVSSHWPIDLCNYALCDGLVVQWNTVQITLHQIKDKHSFLSFWCIAFVGHCLLFHCLLHHCNIWFTIWILQTNDCVYVTGLQVLYTIYITQLRYIMPIVKLTEISNSSTPNLYLFNL